MSNFTQTIGYFEKLITSSSFHLPQVFQRHQKGWTLFLVIRYFHEILDKNVLEEWISPFSTLCRVEKSSKTRSSITTVFTVYSSNQRFHKIVDFTEIFEHDRIYKDVEASNPPFVRVLRRVEHLFEGRPGLKCARIFPHFVSIWY